MWFLRDLTKAILIVFGIIGYVLNVMVIVDTVADPVTGMYILRALGLMFFPLGILLGLFFDGYHIE